MQKSIRFAEISKKNINFAKIRFLSFYHHEMLKF